MGCAGGVCGEAGSDGAVPTVVLLATGGSDDARLARQAAADLCARSGALHVAHAGMYVSVGAYPYPVSIPAEVIIASKTTRRRSSRRAWSGSSGRAGSCPADTCDPARRRGRSPRWPTNSTPISSSAAAGASARADDWCWAACRPPSLTRRATLEQRQDDALDHARQARAANRGDGGRHRRAAGPGRSRPRIEPARGRQPVAGAAGSPAAGVSRTRSYTPPTARSWSSPADGMTVVRARAGSSATGSTAFPSGVPSSGTRSATVPSATTGRAARARARRLAPAVTEGERSVNARKATTGT